ncbi:MAG: hypothetical protein AAF420_10865, partial [Pseudomonadota bacterium]
AGSAYLTLGNTFGGTYKSDNIVMNVGPTNNVSRNGSVNDIVFVDPSGVSVRRIEGSEPQFDSVSGGSVFGLAALLGSLFLVIGHWRIRSRRRQSR